MQASKQLNCLRSSSSALVKLNHCDLYPAAPPKKNGKRTALVLGQAQQRREKPLWFKLLFMAE